MEADQKPVEIITLEQQRPTLEDCLKLLKGERDDQRLAGLFLVTKFCGKDDHTSIGKVYDAVGPRFLDRLLRTGMGQGCASRSGCNNQDAYLQLSVTVLATFCRVLEIAASQDMVSKIPLIVEIMSKGLDLPILEECYEFLLLVSTNHEDGVSILYKSGGMKVLASQMPSLSDGSNMVQLTMRLVCLIISKLSLEMINNEYPSELSVMVTTIAKNFAVLHNALKFDAMHLLSAILSSNYSSPLHNALHLMANEIWSTYIKVGVVAILQNRVAPADKLQALILAESVISIVGEAWLIGQMSLPNIQEPIPADRCLLLVLESSRVEIAVLLNDMAYLRYEASEHSSSAVESILLKQRNLGVAFSLVEKIIKLISSASDDEGAVISESTSTKIISGLNETVSVVLEYLKDARSHGQRKGDDFLASVRVIGSYLAEAPLACKEEVRELLEYMLSIEGEDESTPFYSICFLLPVLCQMTMKIHGCKVVASSGAYKAVVQCLVQLIEFGDCKADDDGSIFLACDTILNLLLKRKEIAIPFDAVFVRLLVSLSRWTEGTDDTSAIMMASSICALIFDSTSEEALVCHPDFDRGRLSSLSRLIARSLAICGHNMASDDAKAEADLYQIVASAYSQWADRFPHIQQAVGQ